MKFVAKRWWFWLLIVIAVAFVIVHTYLALWVRDYVNRKLSEIPGKNEFGEWPDAGHTADRGGRSVGAENQATLPAQDQSLRRSQRRAPLSRFQQGAEGRCDGGSRPNGGGESDEQQEAFEKFNR